MGWIFADGQEGQADGWQASVYLLLFFSIMFLLLVFTSI